MAETYAATRQQLGDLTTIRERIDEALELLGSLGVAQDRYRVLERAEYELLTAGRDIIQLALEINLAKKNEEKRS